jgi:glycerophosphoryl diester phosphodiesterase
MVIGHRGDPSRYPQNAIEGILGSGDVASMAEIDVRPSKDRRLVLSHDPHHGDTTLVEQNWSELASLPLGDGHTIGLLDDLIDQAGEFPLNIEIKNWPSDPDFDPSFAFALKAAALARPIDLITSFHWPTTHAIKERFSGLRTGLIVNDGWDAVGAMSEARRRGHVAVAFHHTLITPEPVRMMTKADGLEVYVWTVNDPKMGIRLADANVTGLITDYPGAMVAALQGEPTT